MVAAAKMHHPAFEKTQINLVFCSLNRIFAPNLKNKMSDDISQSVSQRGRGEEIAENRRIYEVSDELLRRSQLYEAQLRDGQEHVSRFEAEQRVAEQYAKEKGMWVPMHEVFDLGVPGPSGNENDTYVSNDIVYKVNNLLNSGSVVKLLEKISWHNILFTIHSTSSMVLRVLMAVPSCLFYSNVS